VIVRHKGRNAAAVVLATVVASLLVFGAFGFRLPSSSSSNVKTIADGPTFQQWLMNATFGNVEAATGKVDASIPGDFMSAVVTALGAGAVFLGFWDFSILNSGLSTPVTGLPNQQSDEASNAASGLLFGVMAVFLGLFAYLASLSAPHSAHAYNGEMVAAVATAAVGLVGTIFAYLAGTGRSVGNSAIVGGIGVLLGIGAIAMGGYDIYTQLASGPP
jgi:hypothetical protein